MAILHPKDNKAKHDTKIFYYDASRIKFDLSKLHIMDKIEWHRQTGDMVTKALIQATVDDGKLQKIILKLTTPLKQENVIYKARTVRILALENKLMTLGADPKDEEVVKSLIKDRDSEIKVLKSKLKILDAEHTQTKELMAAHEEKEKLIQELSVLKNQIII